MSAALSKADSAIRKFLRENASQFKLLEEGLRALALLETGKDSDIRAEAISSFLGVLSLYKDVGELKLAYPVSSPSSNAINNVIFRLALVLKLFQNLEILIEMIATRRFGQEKKCLVLFIVELAKAVIRMTIFLKRKDSFYSKDFENLQVSTSSNCICGRKQSQAGLVGWRYYCGQRSGRRIYRLDSLKEHKSVKSMEDILHSVSESRSNAEQRWVLQYLCPVCSTQLTTEIYPSTSILQVDPENVRQFGNYVGEILFIFRPVFHVLLAWKYGWRSWTPWCLALLCELASFHLLSRHLSSTRNIETQTMSAEVVNRRIALLYYLIRSPLFEVLFEDKMNKVRERTKRVLLLGPSLDALLSLFMSWRTYWFYTSAS
ncbi:hypothetical protein GAYE_PCTG50G1201 [Galdieria yellowstonensis]|uniref:Peroxisomal membrane protein PEX16 n=1 Tax=Galdieria yellowstonensis TaxID=3028027 RepID=A0AAV9I4I3_9RHOD|nr:hypothetical protein GAYE_PCTG50G1201 [Galdieria yellowstonensis]